MRRLDLSTAARLDHAIAEIHAFLDGRDFSFHTAEDPLCTDGWRMWGFLASMGEW